MLVWINGPFGGGKTQTAHEISRRLPGSVICDPEQVGFGLHGMLPAPLREDFQDLPAWRQAVFEVLDLTLRRTTGTVIAPMTVVEPAYFQQTVGRLREAGHDVRHFALLASRAEIVTRLSERAFGRAVRVILGPEAALRRESFALSKIDICLERLQGEEFADQIWTDHLTVAQVADDIAARCGLALEANTDGPMRGRVRRGWTSLKHIRLR